MGYKCYICKANDVEYEGDVCELCELSRDPYLSNMQTSAGPAPASTRPVTGTGRKRIAIGQKTNPEPAQSRKNNRKVLIGGSTELSNTDPYGNSMTVQNSESEVQVYQPGQAPAVQTSVNTQPAKSVSINPKPNKPLASGITKNISVDEREASPIAKWFWSVFSGVPFTLDNSVTMFQVFPDFSGTTLNAQGNYCDQVIVYGKVTSGSVAENNDVEVYGHRDSKNNIVASKIINKASGTTISPTGALSPVVIRAITFLVLALIVGSGLMLGSVALLWAVVVLLCVTKTPFPVKAGAVLLGLLITYLI